MNTSKIKTMKKEDAIKYLQQLYPNGGYTWLDEQRMEAITMAIEALEASLPPKEELEEYAQRESELFGEREYEVDSLDRNALRKGFYWGCKAGAEWMASQGETAEVGYWNQRGLSLRLDKSLEKLGYKEGDKVIIQIRKK